MAYNSIIDLSHVTKITADDNNLAHLGYVTGTTSYVEMWPNPGRVNYSVDGGISGNPVSVYIGGSDPATPLIWWRMGANDIEIAEQDDGTYNASILGLSMTAYMQHTKSDFLDTEDTTGVLFKRTSDWVAVTNSGRIYPGEPLPNVIVTLRTYGNMGFSLSDYVIISPISGEFLADLRTVRVTSLTGRSTHLGYSYDYIAGDENYLQADNFSDGWIKRHPHIYTGYRQICGLGNMKLVIDWNDCDCATAAIPARLQDTELYSVIDLAPIGYRMLGQTETLEQPGPHNGVDHHYDISSYNIKIPKPDAMTASEWGTLMASITGAVKTYLYIDGEKYSYTPKFLDTYDIRYPMVHNDYPPTDGTVHCIKEYAFNGDSIILMPYSRGGLVFCQLERPAYNANYDLEIHSVSFPNYPDAFCYYSDHVSLPTARPYASTEYNGIPYPHFYLIKKQADMFVLLYADSGGSYGTLESEGIPAAPETKILVDYTITYRD